MSPCPTAARIAVGRPQTVEIQVIKSTNGLANGVLRLWVDGVLTGQYTSVRYPAETLHRVNFSGTYGGGAYNAPSEFNFRILDSFIAIPPG